ncbi:hypothetical protein ACA910_022233 [Epithemia clementina (nom. ined.)]
MLVARATERFTHAAADKALSFANPIGMGTMMSRLGASDRAAGTVLHPVLWATGIKRQHLHTKILWEVESGRSALFNSYSTRILKESWYRIQRNTSRLRARRLLEIAIASMAVRDFRSKMEAVVQRPHDWKNWTRRDWADELLESLGTTKFSRLMSALNRLAQLSLLATPLILMAPLAYVSNTVHKYSWEYALWGIEQAGPTFVKWVQWATTRQDLFSPEFCQYFGKLRDATRGHSWEFTESLLEEDLGPLASHIEIDKKVIGSGCIAQVYRGTLTQAVGQFPKGTKLAVKVQHPDIWAKVCVDFYIFDKVALFLEGLPFLNLRYLSLVDTVRQFRDIMLPQLDLTLEAKHLQRFNRDFSSIDRVNFPTPLNELTTKRILTETFLPGVTILEYLNKPEPVRRELANLGVETTLRMIFLNDFLHGDLHPGNILVCKNEHGKPSLNLLDCGLVVEMGPNQHVNLTKILGAFARREGRLAGQLMVDTSSDCQASEKDIERFVEGVGRVSNQSTNFVEHVGDRITDICYMACRYQVKLEPAFIGAALAVEIIEGIAKELYPDVEVATPALRFIFQAEVMHGIKTVKSWL